MTATERITDLEMLANAILEWLIEEGAVRIDENTIGDFRTVYQICDKWRIDPSTWRKCKRILNTKGQEEGFSICFIQSRGHYVGWSGEEITNDVAKYQVARGWVGLLKETKEIIANATPRQKYWIETRYKGNFKLEGNNDG